MATITPRRFGYLTHASSFFQRFLSTSVVFHISLAPDQELAMLNAQPVGTAVFFFAGIWPMRRTTLRESKPGRPSIGAWGVDLRLMDRSVAPG